MLVRAQVGNQAIGERAAQPRDEVIAVCHGADAAADVVAACRDVAVVGLVDRGGFGSSKASTIPNAKAGSGSII